MARTTSDIDESDKTATTAMPQDFSYASLGSRFVANVIDNLVVIITVFALIMLGDASGSDSIIGVMFLLGIGLSLFYLLILEGLWSGQTLGKKALGIRVIGKDKTEAGIVQSVIRNFIGLIGQTFGAIGLLFGAFSIHQSDRNQRLGDSAASTIVINT